jgi:hypothetical protein
MGGAGYVGFLVIGVVTLVLLVLTLREGRMRKQGR